MARPRSSGLRVTKVGLWFLVFAFIVLLAASNTGNNGLFLVLAVMLATFVVSHSLAAQNLRRLRVHVSAPEEIFAGSPTRLSVKVENLGRLLGRWLLAVSADPEDIEPRVEKHHRRLRPLLIPHLSAGSSFQGRLNLILPRRGRHQLHRLRISSLFPIGFFHKSVQHPENLSLLVFPEIFPPGRGWPTQTSRSGDDVSRRSGWGHDLFGLRRFRHGDDPRSIHWKQTARTGRLIFKEHETEESRRLSILFDNATGELDSTQRQQFERLVSEAATAALDYLERGFEVSLLTRETTLAFASGARQRRRILETLALVEPGPKSSVPMAPEEESVPHLRLTLANQEAVA